MSGDRKMTITCRRTVIGNHNAVYACKHVQRRATKQTCTCKIHVHMFVQEPGFLLIEKVSPEQFVLLSARSAEILIESQTLTLGKRAWTSW